MLIDMVSIGLIAPVLAPLIGTFKSSKSGQALYYGAVTIVFGIANFFGSPILGRLSDRFGRRPVLLIGCSGLALATVSALPRGDWRVDAPLSFCALLQAVATVVALRHFKGPRRKRGAFAAESTLASANTATGAASAG